MTTWQYSTAFYFKHIYRTTAVVLFVSFCLFSFSFVFLMPPGFGPDEEGHFLTGLLRIERVLESSETFCAPYSFDEAFGVASIVARPQEKFPRASYERAVGSNGDNRPRCVSRNFPDKIYGHILSYPGTAIARTMMRAPLESDKYLKLFYLSRVWQLFFVMIALARLTIHICRSNQLNPGGILILATALTPICIQQSTIVTTDTIIIAFSIAAATILLFFPSVKRIDLIIYAVFGLLAAGTKPVLLPIFVAIALFTMVSGNAEIKSLFKKNQFKSAILQRGNQIVMVSMLLPIACIYAYLSAAAGGGVRPAPGVANPSEQLNFILNNPVTVFSMFTTNLIQYLSFSHLLSNLGWLDAGIISSAKNAWSKLEDIAVTLELVMLAGLVYWHKTRRMTGTFNALLRKLFLQIVCGLSGIVAYGFAIILAMYFYENRVGYIGDVVGLQGRYFISLIICGLGFIGALFQTNHSYMNNAALPEHTKTWKTSLLMYGCVISLLSILQPLVIGTILSILIRYY